MRRPAPEFVKTVINERVTVRAIRNTSLAYSGVVSESSRLEHDRIVLKDVVRVDHPSSQRMAALYVSLNEFSVEVPFGDADITIQPRRSTVSSGNGRSDPRVATST